MISSIPTMSIRQQEFLADFKRDLDSPLKKRIEKRVDVEHWLTNVRDILKKSVPEHSKDPLEVKALALQEQYKWPLLDKRANTHVLGILKGEMQTALESKAKQLGSMLSFQKMFSVLPSYQIEDFLTVIRSNCQRHISEGVPPEKAFALALSYALSRSLIQTSDLEGEEKLQRYVCVFRQDIVESQPAYLRVDSQDQPREVYHEDDIMTYLADSRKDPVTRDRKTVKDLRKDPKEKEIVRSLISSFKYPQISSSAVQPIQTPNPPAPSVFFAARIGYPLAKEAYQQSRKDVDYNLAALKAEEVLSLAIDLFEPFLRDAREEDFSFLPWSPKPAKLEREFTNAQRLSYSWSFNTQNSASGAINIWEPQTQFMQEFLKFHMGQSSSSMSIEPLRTKLESQMQEYVEYFQEVQSSDIADYQKKELQEQALKRIITEESSSSSSSSKKRSSNPLHAPLVKKVKGDPSHEDVQMQMLNDFFM